MSVDMKDYLAYQQGYEAGKRDAASPWHRGEEPPKLPDKDYCWIWCIAIWNGQTVPMRYERTLKRGKRDERWTLFDRISNPPERWMYLPEPPKEDADEP